MESFDDDLETCGVSLLPAAMSPDCENWERNTYTPKAKRSWLLGKRHGSPAEITTDGLRSYKAAMTDLGNTGKQEVGRWANSRVENSHLPFRR